MPQDEPVAQGLPRNRHCYEHCDDRSRASAAMTDRRRSGCPAPSARLVETHCKTKGLDTQRDRVHRRGR